MEQILTAHEVARELRCGRITVYRLVKKGELPAFKIGSDWRFARGEVERWIAARTINPKDNQ